MKHTHNHTAVGAATAQLSPLPPYPHQLPSATQKSLAVYSGYLDEAAPYPNPHHPYPPNHHYAPNSFAMADTRSPAGMIAPPLPSHEPTQLHYHHHQQQQELSSHAMEQHSQPHQPNSSPSSGLSPYCFTPTDIKTSLVSFMLEDSPSPEVIAEVLDFVQYLHVGTDNNSPPPPSTDPIAFHEPTHPPSTYPGSRPQRHPPQVTKRLPIDSLPATVPPYSHSVKPDAAQPPRGSKPPLNGRQTHRRISSDGGGSAGSAGGTGSDHSSTSPELAPSAPAPSTSAAGGTPMPFQHMPFSLEDIISLNDEKLEKLLRQHRKTAALAPCKHAAHWRLLRTKKGIRHFLCSLCGVKWRVPHEGPWFPTDGEGPN